MKNPLVLQWFLHMDPPKIGSDPILEFAKLCFLPRRGAHFRFLIGFIKLPAGAIFLLFRFLALEKNAPRCSRKRFFEKREKIRNTRVHRICNFSEVTVFPCVFLARHGPFFNFFHFFEKVLPAAAGSIILPNARLQILPKTVGQTINPVHLASFWSRHPLQKPFWFPPEIALPCLTCAHLLLGDPIFESVVHIMLGSFCSTALFVVAVSFFIHMF